MPVEQIIMAALMTDVLVNGHIGGVMIAAGVP